MEPSTDEFAAGSAESLAWLRARGVEVETPAERKAAAEALKRGTAERAALDPSSPDARSFTYVRIPHDPHAPMTVETAVVQADARGDGDVLKKLLTSSFGSGSVDGELLGKSPHVHQMAGSVGGKTLSALTPEGIRGLGGSTETLRLGAGRPRAEDGGQVTDTVQLYLDEVGALKRLPVNGRASALVARCGYGSGVSIHGDAFVGRLRTRESVGSLLRRSVDFFLDDMLPSSPWQRFAAEENLAAQAKEGRLGGVSAEEMTSGGGTGEGYVWTQSADGEVEVTIRVPAGTRAKQCKIAMKKKSLSVAVVAADVALHLTLWGAIAVDDSTWCVDDDAIVVTLEKSDCAQTWPTLTQ
jgi:hypothetical protein